jgi:hypothetical protein
MTKNVVIRLAPVSNVPMIVDANSLNNGRLKAVFSDRDAETEIGIDYFRASGPVEIGYAHKIVQEYAKKHNIPSEEFLVRARLPKTNFTKPRKTNDSEATSLKLVKNSQAEQPKEESDLTAMAQAMQDAHNKRKDDVKPEEQKASAEKPEGAVVKRSQGEKKQRRGYVKKDKERSARSKAAYERYVKEIGQHVADNPSIMEPAVPGPGVSAQDVSDAEFQFALKLAKLLKGIM